MGMPSDQSLAASREKLKRCFSDLTSLAHAVAQLENITQHADESLHLCINKYSKMHYAATGKTAQDNTDPPRSFRLLASINNTHSH